MVCDNTPVSIIKAIHLLGEKMIQGLYVQFAFKVLPWTQCLSSLVQWYLLVNKTDVIIARSNSKSVARLEQAIVKLENFSQAHAVTAEIKWKSRAVIETFEPFYTEEQENLSSWLL